MRSCSANVVKNARDFVPQKHIRTWLARDQDLAQVLAFSFYEAQFVNALESENYDDRHLESENRYE